MHAALIAERLGREGQTGVEDADELALGAAAHHGRDIPHGGFQDEAHMHIRLILGAGAGIFEALIELSDLLGRQAYVIIADVDAQPVLAAEGMHPDVQGNQTDEINLDSPRSSRI